VDYSQKFQTMVGFGAFGAQNVPWTEGPFTSPAFVDMLVNDLGTTIVRDEVPTNFEYVNDNADPNVTDLSKFNVDRDYPGTHRPLSVRVQFLKDMKAANPEVKFIASVWSPPAWMKHNNALTNGTKENSAPNYTNTPNSSTNQLKVEMYEEFAEMCVAYIRVLKRETGIDLYAFSIQNEPRFSQSYQSCVYNGAALRDVLKVVGRRFQKEGIQTLLFLPEDVGWLGGVESMIRPTLDDPEARQYLGAVAVHGYDLDGIKPNSPSINTWRTMYNWGAPYNLPLWMTETSGFKNDWNGAMDLAEAIYTALRHGNVSAWVFWAMSEPNITEYNLVGSGLQKSKRYFTSRQFYKHIRPGMVRVEATSTDENIAVVAFWHPTTQRTTLVLLNVGDSDKLVRLRGADLPAQLEGYRSSATEEGKAMNTANTGKALVLSANSVTTLYSK
jgi:O-glycosyl hydrolase